MNFFRTGRGDGTAQQETFPPVLGTTTALDNPIHDIRKQLKTAQAQLLVTEDENRELRVEIELLKRDNERLEIRNTELDRVNRINVSWAQALRTRSHIIVEQLQALERAALSDAHMPTRTDEQEEAEIKKIHDSIVRINEEQR
jgi:hypothetical protein